MKLALKNVKGRFDPKDVFKKIIKFINIHEFFVVFLILLFLIGYASYVWYQFVYNYQWSEARKEEYMRTKNAADGFNAIKFEKVLGNINDREENYKKNIDDVKDIFRLK